MKKNKSLEVINGQMNISTGNTTLNIQSSCLVTLKEEFVIFTDNGPIELEVEICADMVKIPEEYREIFMNMLTTKYLNRVSFGENPFSKCNPPKKMRWWEKFFKAK